MIAGSIHRLKIPYQDYGHCACLSGECLKRYYLMTDYVDGHTYYARFCNEYLKLKHHEYYHKDRIYRGTSDILMNEVGVPKGYVGYWNERRVWFVVCQRPFCYISIPLQDALTYFSEYNNRKMRMPILNFISKISNDKARYKKYQNLLPITKTFLNKMDDTYDSQKDERIVLSNGFALYIFNSKLNLQ